MQGSTGFAYFVVFASVISAFMSFFFAVEFPVIVPYFENRNSKKTWCIQLIQAILFTLLAVAVAFLTWSAIEGEFGLIYDAIAILYIVVFLFYTAFAHKDFPVSKSSFQRWAMQIGVVFYVIMLPGLVCFALSYRNQALTAEYRRIDMLIQNSTVEFDGQYPCSSDGSEYANGNYKNQYCGAYKATFNVNWGREWACPDNTDIWCDAWITERECIIQVDKTTTTQTEFAMYAAQIEDCVKETYGLPVMGQQLDKEVQPELKDDWPVVPFLGSCSSRCAAEPLDTDMFQVAENIKMAGLFLSCSGAVLFFIYYCLIFGQDMKEVCIVFGRKSKNMSSSFWRVASSSVTTSINSTTSQDEEGESSSEGFHSMDEHSREDEDYDGSMNQNDEEDDDDNDDDDDDNNSADVDIEQPATRTTTTTTAASSSSSSYQGPVMVEAQILYTDDEEDYDDDDDDESGSFRSGDDDDESSSSSQQQQQDEASSSSSSMDGSRSSGYAQSLDLEDIDLAAEPCGSYHDSEDNDNNAEQDGEDDDESFAADAQCNNDKSVPVRTAAASKVEEMEIDV